MATLSPEGLDALVRSGDAGAVAQALVPMPEDDRRRLAATALELRRRHDSFRGSKPLGPGVDDASRIAVYGTASLTELRGLSRLLAAPPRDVGPVLRIRPASFLEPFAPWFLEHYPRWDVIRVLVKDRLMATPTSPWYTLAMIERPATIPAQLLRDDPALLDDEVWRLFEVEGSGEFSLAAHDKYVPDDRTWQTALVGISGRDPAFRERCLDTSLEALARDMAAFRAGWFSRFHEALEPTLDDRERRAEVYARLLRSPVRATVSFAVAALDELARASRLPHEGVIERLGMALASDAAGTARAALRILERAAKADPARRPAVARAAAEGLGHPSTEVQAAALDLVERTGEPGDDALAAALRSQASSVHASQRGALERVLADLGATTSAVASVSLATEPGVPDSLPAASRPIGPLDPTRALVPIAGLETLVDVLTGALETGGPPDDLERALDGISRLGRTGDDFERRTAPLVKRARTLLGRRWEGADPRVGLASLVLRWARGMAEAPTEHLGVGAFLAARMAHVGGRAAAGQVAPLLAAPTHAGGWIDPVALVDRLASWPAGTATDHLDAVAALLRLAPDRRDLALRAMTGLVGEVSDALRHALGGSVEIGPTAALWVAAARARSPGEDDPRVEARHRNLGPDAGRAARIDLATGKHRGDVDRIMHPLGLTITLEPPMPRSPRPDLPTVLLLEDAGWQTYVPGRNIEQRRWEATIWPSWRESWCAVGTVALGRNVDWWSAEWTNRAFLEPLLDPWVRIGPMAATLLGVALGAKEGGERGLGADVVIAAIEDARLDVAGLLGGLSRASELGIARPRRWAQALADVAAVSSRHAWTVQEAGARVISVLEPNLTGEIVPLLRVIHELVHETGMPLSAEAAAAIAGVKGGGQARRLADAIGALSERLELPIHRGSRLQPGVDLDDSASLLDLMQDPER